MVNCGGVGQCRGVCVRERRKPSPMDVGSCRSPTVARLLCWEERKASLPVIGEEAICGSLEGVEGGSP